MRAQNRAKAARLYRTLEARPDVFELHSEKSSRSLMNGRIASVNPPPFRSHHSGEWSASWLEREDIATTMSMADCLGVFVLWSDERSVLESDLEQLTDFRPYELVE